MVHRWLLGHRYLLMSVIVLIALLAVACGEDATSTPRPTATSAPTAVPATATPTTAAMEPTATSAAPKPTKAPATPTPTAVPQPTATPAQVMAKVDRLIVGSPLISNETYVPWYGSSGHVHMLPMYDTLVGVDRFDGAIIPRLATTWEMAPDGLSWTFGLAEGVQFHNEWGEFTNQDVVNGWERVSQEAAFGQDTPTWRRIITGPGDFGLDGDHKITFNLQVASPELLFTLSAKLGIFLVTSKAQWEAGGGDNGGDEALFDQPSGTGPFRFVSKVLGVGVRYERVEDHWRDTATFKELELRYLQEDVTRLAALLAGEVHITEMSKDLYEPAEAAGGRVLTAPTHGTPVTLFFGGNYQLSLEFFDPSDPMTDVRVRTALTKAVDKEAINDTLYRGQGKVAWLQFNASNQPGWDPAWDTRGPAEFGFDPEGAKALLADAGYGPGDIKIIFKLFPLPGSPELIPVQEAISSMWQDIGIDTELENIDLGTFRPTYRNKRAHHIVWAFNPGSGRSPRRGAGSFHSALEGACCPSFESQIIQDRLAILDTEMDLEVRDRLQREIGEELFSNAATLPIMFVPLQAVIDPEIIAEYNFSGSYLGLTDLEFVVPAK